MSMSQISALPRESPLCSGRKRGVVVIAGLLCLGVLAMVWALSAGEIAVSARTVFGALSGTVSGMEADIIRHLRLPRAVAVFVCGGLLATAGALMQVLLRNPLADPYVLGISGGAAVGALSAMLFGLAPILVDGAAFAGALAAMLLVFGLAHGDGSWTQTRLLLTGVIVAAGCGAAITLMLSIAPDTRLQSMLFWLMGDASGASRPWPAAVALLVGLVVILPFARDLNVLARGEQTALALGVRVQRLRYMLYVLASLLTVADTAARTVIAPVQLPVGVLTALIGVPVFLFLLSRHPR